MYAVRRCRLSFKGGACGKGHLFEWKGGRVLGVLGVYWVIFGAIQMNIYLILLILSYLFVHFSHNLNGNISEFWIYFHHA
jgi:hypothetical protein